MTPNTKNQANQTQAPQATAPGEHTNLSYLYGSIGIQAVAAAARYADVRKKPASMSAGPRIDLRFVESAG